jgi:hypothetical protein
MSYKPDNSPLIPLQDRFGEEIPAHKPIKLTPNPFDVLEQEKPALLATESSGEEGIIPIRVISRQSNASVPKRIPAKPPAATVRANGKSIFLKVILSALVAIVLVVGAGAFMTQKSGNLKNIAGLVGPGIVHAARKVTDSLGSRIETLVTTELVYYRQH